MGMGHRVEERSAGIKPPPGPRNQKTELNGQEMLGPLGKETRGYRVGCFRT